LWGEKEIPEEELEIVTQRILTSKQFFGNATVLVSERKKLVK